MFGAKKLGVKLVANMKVKAQELVAEGQKQVDPSQRMVMMMRGCALADVATCIEQVLVGDTSAEEEEVVT